MKLAALVTRSMVGSGAVTVAETLTVAVPVAVGKGVVIVVPILDIIFVVIAAVKASNGEFYRYPLTWRLIT